MEDATSPYCIDCAHHRQSTQAKGFSQRTGPPVARADLAHTHSHAYLSASPTLSIDAETREEAAVRCQKIGMDRVNNASYKTACCRKYGDVMSRLEPLPAHQAEHMQNSRCGVSILSATGKKVSVVHISKHGRHLVIAIPQDSPPSNPANSPPAQIIVK